MELTFLGATKTVTGSKYLLTIDSKKILIDCGLYQGYKELRLRNWNRFPVDSHSIDAVILTHAHIDHSGYLPLLVKNGFKGKIYCTHGTKDLCSILLPDSGHIQEEDAYRANKYGYSKHKPALPLYTRDDAIRALDQFYALPFNENFELFKMLSFIFYPAGHIIGSSLIKLEHKNKSSDLSTLMMMSSAGLKPIAPPQIRHPPSLLTTSRIFNTLKSTLVMVSIVSAVPAGEVMALDDVFGMMSPASATIATTIGVVRFPGMPPTLCLSMT